MSHCGMASINGMEKEFISLDGFGLPAKLHEEMHESNASVEEFPATTRTRARERIWSTCLSTLVASIPALLLGYTIVFPSSALLVLMDGWSEGNLPSKDYQFSTELADVFGALGPVGALIGGPVGGWIADRWGRKCGLLFSSVPYILGYLLLSYAHYSSTATVFKTLLLIGRFVSGLGMGWASTVAPIYVGEISSSRFRGLFATVMQLYISVGVLMCYGLSTFFPYYHVALASVMVIAVFVVLGVWLKETPRWLLANKMSGLALKTLKRLRGKNYDVISELETMKLSLTAEDSKRGVLREFKRKSVLVPFVTLLLVFFFQQIGGLSAQGAYATVIFTDAGVRNPQLASTMSVGISDIVGNVIAGILVDRMGRKPLLIVSGIGMGIGNTLLGVHFYITRPSLCSGSGVEFSGDDPSFSDDVACNMQYGPLAIVSMITYNFMFSIGWASVPWVLLPELLPLKVRGIGGGFAVMVSWITSALVAGAYLSYVDVVTLWFGWWSFALLNFASVAFAMFVLVETKGKNLESIQAAFEKKWNL